MTGRRRVTLRGRVAIIVAVTVAVPLVLVSLGLQIVSGATLVAAIDEDLERIATELVRDRGGMLSQPSMRRGRFGGASGIVQLVAADGRSSAQLGTVDARLNPDGIELPVDPQVLAVARGELDAFVRTVEVEEQPMRILTTRIAPALAVQVARPMDEVDEFITALRRRTLIGTLLAVSLASMAAWWIAGRTIRPVSELIHQLEAVRRTSDLSRRVEVRGEDEIARVALAFNAMLARLEDARRAQQQLTADASHELRTPVTSLRTNIEVLLLDASSEEPTHPVAPRLDATSRRELLDDVVGQLDELATMVDGLVQLAQVDASIGDVAPLDLVPLVEQVAASTRRRHPQRADDVHVVLPARELGSDPTLRPVVMGDRTRIVLAITSMLDNAVKYAPSGRIDLSLALDVGSALEVDSASVTRVPGAAVVTVRDRGPGIAAEDLEHVTEPFYRAPGARSAPGAGLGLALVASVATSHEGRLGIRNVTEPDGLEVTLAFPLAPSAVHAGPDAPST
jgi:two-component system, OmpR family, sensor histidine kinase MprB